MKFTIICHLATFLLVTTKKNSQMTNINYYEFHDVVLLLIEIDKLF